MNPRTLELARQAGLKKDHASDREYMSDFDWREFAELIVAECVNKIETYAIPVGNSASGELACEWTYNALKEIRDDIKEHFGVEK